MLRNKNTYEIFGKKNYQHQLLPLNDWKIENEP